MGRIKRLMLTAVVAVTVVAAAVPAAEAGSRWSYRSSSKTASANWLQVDDPVDGIVGWHLGDLWVYETTKGKGDAFASIRDAFCPEGVNPSWGGGHGTEHGEPPPDDPCTYDFRYGEGFGMAFTMDNKLNQATLKGGMTIYGGHGGDPLGRPAVDMAWNGTGAVTQYANTWRYRTDCCWESYSSKGKNRSAAMAGFIGPMGFDPDRSGGFMSISTDKGSGGSK